MRRSAYGVIMVAGGKGQPAREARPQKRRIREMAKIGQPYTSGAWLVRAGSEEDFIERWTNFTQWSLKNAPGAESFVLLRDITERRRFVSFGAWDDVEAVVAWRQRPEFSELLGECRALCEEFEPHVYT